MQFSANTGTPYFSVSSAAKATVPEAVGVSELSSTTKGLP